MFFENKGAHLSSAQLLITISVRFTYLIQENTFLDWQQASVSRKNLLSLDEDSTGEKNDTENDNDEVLLNLRSLPFGSFQDCVE